jgi:hypothetical protein
MRSIVGALLGSGTWLVVGFFSFIYPQADSLERSSPNPNWGWAAAALGLLAYLPWARPPGARDSGEGAARSSVLLLYSLVLQSGLVVVASLTVHRDFLTLLFQSGCIHFSLFLGISHRLRSGFFFRFAEKLYALTIGVIVFFFCWIAVMGYAIAVRSEPRWIPSIAYNVVNFGLCLFLYAAAVDLRAKSKRELRIASGGLFLDLLDITPLINPASLPIARFLLTLRGEERLTCRRAQEIFGRETSACDCSKATLCPRYKYLYNRIHELNRVFSALRLGNVLYPERRRDILVEGWSFILDASVAIVEAEGGIPEADAFETGNDPQ